MVKPVNVLLLSNHDIHPRGFQRFSLLTPITITNNANKDVMNVASEILHSDGERVLS